MEVALENIPDFYNFCLGSENNQIERYLFKRSLKANSFPTETLNSIASSCVHASLLVFV